MVTIKVKGGTPEEGVSLCVSCSWGVVRKGYRASEEEVFCRMIEPNTRVPYTVQECSGYSDRRIPSLYFMEKTAWVLLTKKAGRTNRLRDFRRVPEDRRRGCGNRSGIFQRNQTRRISERGCLTFAFCSPIVRSGRGNGKRVARRLHCRLGSPESAAAR